MNAVEIEQAVSLLAEQPFDRAEFPFEFLRAFGNKEVTIKRLRKGDNNASDVAGGVLQRNNIHIATCAEGAVAETLQALRDSPRTAANKVRFILATDGVEFHAEDLTADDPPVICEYAKFPDRFGFFLPLAGITTVKQIRESAFDIRATGRLNRLYRQLLADNPDWDRAERRPDMNHFMARLIFCFFAEDTGIFNGEGLFTRTVDQMSERDASNMHEVIEETFRAMNTPVSHDGNPDDRYRKAAGTPRWADAFPYVNGGLFSGDLSVPRFSRIARSYFLTIGGLDWTQINPDIFGSMIQAVADDEERGELGMHYCSAVNGAAGLVTTNSVCQGEQVALLWPLVFRLGMSIAFAHTSFKWSNLASDKAGVTVVIIGLSRSVMPLPRRGRIRPSRGFWTTSGNSDSRAQHRQRVPTRALLTALFNCLQGPEIARSLCRGYHRNRVRIFRRIISARAP